eukprot:UN24110
MSIKNTDRTTHQSDYSILQKRLVVESCPFPHFQDTRSFVRLDVHHKHILSSSTRSLWLILIWAPDREESYFWVK